MRAPTFDPRATESASRVLINYKRDFFESSPILIEGELWDCDEKALMRIDRAIDFWDDLRVDYLDWTLADNSTISVTKSDLIFVQTSIKSGQAIRGLRLHAFATELKSMLPNVTVLDVETADWPI